MLRAVVGATVSGRRVLLTGLSSFWGGRLAQALETDPTVEVILGIDTSEPVVELRRTEFVRCDENFSILSRLVKATQVDTVIHAAMIVDSTTSSDRRVHETNVIGTMNLLAAVAGPHSAVRTLVTKSSTLVYGAGQRDPAFFDERTARTSPARTRVERSLLEVEEYLRSFRDERPDVQVTTLRFANVLGQELVTALSRILSLPLVPYLAGFDPLLQFVEEQDVIHAVQFVVESGVSGVYNVAGDGRLPWSEVCALVGKHMLPLSPVGTELLTGPLSRLGLPHIPPELLGLLRFGRGVDNRKLKMAGFRYRYDTVGAVRRFAEARRLRHVVGRTRPDYRYQQDVEDFFRRSSTIVRPG